MLDTEKSKAIEVLIQRILEVPGDKIVSLVLNCDVFRVDIDKNGNIGSHPHHKMLFELKLYTAFDNGGGMTIREFLLLRSKQKMPNGQEMWIPEKNLYGVLFKEREWVGLDATTVQQIHEIDYQTGMSISQEIGVHYRDFRPTREMSYEN